VDLTFTPRELAFQAECQSWLRTHVPIDPLPSVDTTPGFAAHVAWEKTLFEAGWSVVSWPKAYGGREASLTEWLLFEEAYWACDAPRRVTQNGIFLLAPSLFSFGTDEQKERLLRPMAAAETLWAQGWSEPNSGSDLASLRSSARRIDGGWRLSGQKTWCTRAVWCDGLYGLFRTDPNADRPHRGLTYFMVDLRAPGITVRPVNKLDGDPGFAEIFLDDVFVPDIDVLGQVNGGWRVAMSTTSSERGLTLRSPGRFLATANRLVQLWRERGDPSDTGLRDRVLQICLDAQAYRLHTFRTVARMQSGTQVGSESSLAKLFWSELDVAAHEVALDLLGPDAERTDAPWSKWLKGWQFALAGPIYAGTNEIQRNVVAERVLGLPRK
jgi:alkylation response protein AidB-like acyl-CoA dehydrogenase